MKRSARSEHALIARLTELFRGGRATGIRLGIGDDAAVLSPSRTPGVWTIDTSVEGVHFDLRWLSPADVGARSFHAAVSDLAAMGARPKAALSSLIVPARFSDRDVISLARGQASAARLLGCPIIGGNLSRGSELSVTTTAFGAAARPLTRAKARAGDEVWLFGDVGLAAAGLRCLEESVRRRPLRRAARAAVEVCIDAWQRPRALVREGLRLARGAHAAIDVSDGLGRDARHIAAQSEVNIVFEETALVRVLRPELLVVSELLREPPLAFALSGGEDYALVATGPKVRRPSGAKRVGRVERGSGVELEQADGARRPVGARGFDHFDHVDRERRVAKHSR